MAATGVDCRGSGCPTGHTAVGVVQRGHRAGADSVAVGHAAWRGADVGSCTVATYADIPRVSGRLHSTGWRGVTDGCSGSIRFARRVAKAVNTAVPGNDQLRCVGEGAGRCWCCAGAKTICHDARAGVSALTGPRIPTGRDSWYCGAAAAECPRDFNVASLCAGITGRDRAST